MKRWTERTFFGWWIVGASIWIQVLVAMLMTQSFGTYVAVWKNEFGWSATAFAVAYALQRGLTAVSSPAHGWLLKRFGPRIIMRVGIVLLGVGFILLSRIDSLASFYLVVLLMGLGANLGGFLSVITTVVSWFERRRSSALALVSAGVSIGGLLVPLVAWSLTTFGWRATAAASGVIVLIGALPFTRVMRGTPEAYGLAPYGVAPTRPYQGGRADGGTPRESARPPDFSTRQALATRAFWFLSLGHAFAVTVAAAVLVHLVVHLNAGLGYSIQAAATVVAVMTAFTLAGQLFGGLLGDRFNKRLVAVLAMFGHAVALLALAFAQSGGWVLFFAVVHGLSLGMRGPVMQALRADYFGRSSFATIMGLSVSIVMVGQIAGPLIAGRAADLLGDYRLAFTVLAAVAAFGALFFVIAKKPDARGAHRVASAVK